ncbi:MAG TPA: cytochrome P460 family protein [Terriglobales bacterium]|nr:cytochrome P460 family protein [Terriglobales bacterium]
MLEQPSQADGVAFGIAGSSDGVEGEANVENPPDCPVRDAVTEEIEENPGCDHWRLWRRASTGLIVPVRGRAGRHETSNLHCVSSGTLSDRLDGVGVEVKDETRFPDKWAYFNFAEDTKSASANPKAGCWSCHDEHAAVEHVFVQFYPTLKPVAKKFGTYREAAENVQ